MSQNICGIVPDEASQQGLLGFAVKLSHQVMPADTSHGQCTGHGRKDTARRWLKYGKWISLARRPLQFA
jgi:hypothetical protein